MQHIASLDSHGIYQCEVLWHDYYLFGFFVVSNFYYHSIKFHLANRIMSCIVRYLFFYAIRRDPGTFYIEFGCWFVYGFNQHAKNENCMFSYFVHYFTLHIK
jgi:hypothetical protein